MSNDYKIYDSTRPKVQVEKVNTFTTQVYGWMTVGLSLTAFVAWLVFKSGMYVKFLPYWWMFAIAALFISMTLSVRLMKLSFTATAGLFLTYSTLEGLIFGSILPAYAMAFGGQVIWAAFGTAATVFSIAVLYGIFSKSDLTALGPLLRIALIGLMVVSLLFFVMSMFMPMQGMVLVISYIGLIIFLGLTVYDAQQIRNMSEQVDGFSALSCKISLVMAFRMYLNVITIFWYLLQIFASNKKR